MTTGEITFGKVIELNEEQGRGLIRDENKKTYQFNTNDSRDTLKLGQIVAFQFRKPLTLQAYHIQRIYLSKDKWRIIDRRKSHLHTGITSYLIKVACSKITCDKEKILRIQVNFKKEIGVTTCVPITEKDELVYAIREGRFGHSQFVLNREPEPTKSMTIVLRRRKNYYKILTAYIGKTSELEPKTRKATLKSIEFWKHHAMIFGSETIVEGTVTEECPWTHRGID